MLKELKTRFNKAMFDLYHQTLNEVKYNATLFFEMLNRHGGVETAHRLLSTKEPSTGYTKLWELKKLNLSVEAVIWDNKEYHSLFSNEELETAKKRLENYEYFEQPGIPKTDKP